MSFSLGEWVGQCVSHLTLKLGVWWAVFPPQDYLPSHYLSLLTDQRIHLFLKCCLVLGVQRSLLDLPGGLTLIEAELAELGQKFVSLTHHNQQVFGPYYTEILKSLLPPAQVLETEVASL